MEPLGLVVFLLIAVYVAWFWQRSDFTIRVRQGQVEYRGKLPVPLRQAVADALEKRPPDGRSFQIHGNWKGRRIQVWFRGSISRGEQQRIRNIVVNGQ